MTKRNIAIWSLVISTILFVVLLSPELTKLHFKKNVCTITSSSIATRYCCEKQCLSCNELFRYKPLCSSLINETNVYKNLTKCMLGENEFCANEGVKCDGGITCCSYKPIDAFEPNGRVICDKEVHHHECQLHCPTCYTVHVSYSYMEQQCHNKPCPPFVIVHKIIDCEKNIRKAENIISSEQPGTRKTCYVNPDNTHDIIFNLFPKWKFVVFFLVISPCTLILLTEILEYLIKKSVDWSFPFIVDSNHIFTYDDVHVDEERQRLCSYYEAPPQYPPDPPDYSA